MAQIIEFVGNHWVLSSVFAFFLAMLVTSELRNLSLGIKKISPQEAILMNNKEGLTLVDVRDESAFKTGHIAGSLNIPLKQLEEKNSKLAKMKDKPILITCGSGHISVGAGSILRKKGFNHLYLLKGGITAWKEAHMPLSKTK